jgi:hypothetical protein
MLNNYCLTVFVLSCTVHDELLLFNYVSDDYVELLLFYCVCVALYCLNVELLLLTVFVFICTIPMLNCGFYVCVELYCLYVELLLFNCVCVELY